MQRCDFLFDFLGGFVVVLGLLFFTFLTFCLPRGYSGQHDRNATDKRKLK